MPRQIMVKAARLRDPVLRGKARVIKEGTVDRYITEDAPQVVPLTAYYIRKLGSGELVEVRETEDTDDERRRIAERLPDDQGLRRTGPGTGTLVLDDGLIPFGDDDRIGQ